MDDKIQLGQAVRDVVTGVTGYVIGYTEWLTGCDTVDVLPCTLGKKEMAAHICFDVLRIEPTKDLPKKYGKPGFTNNDAPPLGARVQELLTEAEGIVIGITYWFNGPATATVSFPNKENNEAPCWRMECGRLKVIGTRFNANHFKQMAEEVSKPTGGPAPVVKDSKGLGKV